MLANHKNRKYPLPVRICYLKDDRPKPVTPSKQPNLSLTFLASYLQHQSSKTSSSHIPMQNVSHSHQVHDNFLTQQTSPTQDQAKRITKSYIRQKNIQPSPKAYHTETKTNYVQTYQKWLDIKSKEKKSVDETRFLNNLVGTNWDEDSNLASVMKPSKKRDLLKKTITKVQDVERKDENARMMKAHFQNFLHNIKPHAEPTQVDEPNVFTTKIDSRLAKKQPSFQEKLSQNDPELSFLYTYTRQRSKPKTAPKDKRKVRGFENIAEKVGFKVIPNFEWSRVNRNMKFKMMKSDLYS